MWDFQSLRDSVQSHASGLFQNISDRIGRENEPQHDAKVTQRDAMKNVVTPKSIPRFTLPPLLGQDPVQGVSDMPDFGHQRRVKSLTTNGVSKTNQCDAHLDTLKISHREYGVFEDENEPTPLRHRKSAGSASSLSIKALMQRKRSDTKSPQPMGRNALSKTTDSCDEPHNYLDARIREQSGDQPGLGLQHLMSTRGGFSTLKESPNTRRKESLFFAADPLRKHPSQDLHPKKDASTSPGSDGNNSCLSSPRESPAPSPRKRSFAKSDRRHASKHSLSVEATTLRRSSFNGENIYTCASDTDDRPTSEKLDKRRLSVSEHDVSKKIDPVRTPAIRLCLTYLAQHRRLNVSILEGKDFIPGHSVYLKVSLLPRHDRGHRTDPIKIEDANPSIRERLTFESVDEEDIPHMSLKVCCKEKASRIRHADIVGEGILALCDINFKAPNDIWINFNPYEEEEAPHIQLCLCYDAMLGCLTVDVVAARNVPKGSLGRQPDCFVTLTEILPNAKIAKKQTKIVHRTQNPVFHESFLFSLCTDAQTPDELVIIATLYVKDRVRGTTEPVGEALLGQLVNNWSGRSQWAQALANEGEAVTHWHPLIPSHT